MVAQSDTIRTEGKCPTAEAILQQRLEQVRAFKRLRDLFEEHASQVAGSGTEHVQELCEARGLPKR